VPAVAGDDGGQIDRPHRLGRQAVGAQLRHAQP
jgi:hypothetical protein